MAGTRRWDNLVKDFKHSKKVKRTLQVSGYQEAAQGDYAKDKLSTLKCLLGSYLSIYKMAGTTTNY